ncbi:MAG: hypothetical protein DMG73_12110 [Acidobacteria bacterium]|nr:MAG: hypothetical protein DMG73_12110 [Acidobacteriota bacterium]
MSHALSSCDSPARAVSSQVDARRVLGHRDADSAGCTGGPALRVRPDGLAQLLSLAHCPGATGTALLPPLRGDVTTPTGEKFPIKSDELRQALEAHSGRELFLLYDYRGSYDVAPVSLISRQTITRISEESETKEDSVRFRPNLLVDLEGGEAFDELNWVGRIVRVGDAARIAITEVDQRCMMITLDPASAKPSPAVLRCVAQQHKQCAGVYATVLTPGEVRVGDTVSLES